MGTHVKAEELAKHPYFIMTTVDATTEGHTIYFVRVLEVVFKLMSSFDLHRLFS